MDRDTITLSLQEHKISRSEEDLTPLIQLQEKLKNFKKLKLNSHFPKKNFFICFNDSPSKMMKNAFYFILKALFLLKIFKFLS